MSYIYIKKIIPGIEASPYRSIENSFEGAPIVWDILANKYLNQKSYMNCTEELWALWQNKELPEYERTVLTMTFDNVYILKNNLPQMVKDLTQFFKENMQSNGKTAKTYAWSSIIACLNKTSTLDNIQALGFQFSSASQEAFKDFDNEGNEIPFDWNKSMELFEGVYHLDKFTLKDNLIQDLNDPNKIKSNKIKI